MVALGGEENFHAAGIAQHLPQRVSQVLAFFKYALLGSQEILSILTPARSVEQSLFRGVIPVQPLRNRPDYCAGKNRHTHRLSGTDLCTLMDYRTLVADDQGLIIFNQLGLFIGSPVPHKLKNFRMLFA